MFRRIPILRSLEFSYQLCVLLHLPVSLEALRAGTEPSTLGEVEKGDRICEHAQHRDRTISSRFFAGGTSF